MTSLQVTNVVFLRNPPEEGGYGFSQFATAGTYATPVVSIVATVAPSAWVKYFQISVIIGELVGRYLNDWIMNTSIKRNNGVFEAESRLWYCHLVTRSFADYLTLNQGLLCRFASIRNWFCSVRRSYPESPNCRGSHHGLGHRRVCYHDHYSSGVCI